MRAAALRRVTDFAGTIWRAQNQQLAHTTNLRRTTMVEILPNPVPDSSSLATLEKVVLST
jgi:hypothetical protein